MKGIDMNSTGPCIPRHEALVNTSVDDARSSLHHYNSTADLETIKKAIRAELKKGPQARATMIQLLKNKIHQLEKRAMDWGK